MKTQIIKNIVSIVLTVLAIAVLCHCAKAQNTAHLSYATHLKPLLHL